MLTLTGNKVKLRPLEPEDLDFIHQIENNEIFWELSSTQTPYSRFLIRQYLENAHQDIYEAKQLRLLIEDLQENKIGLIDLFDFDPANKRAGIGILIATEENRGKGLGSQALELLCKYAFTHLKLHQVYANIGQDNQGSIKLFEKMGFEKIGLKKDWNLVNGHYKNEYLFQLINHVY